MLVFGTDLTDIPVLSLQTATPIAQASQAIINPHDLKIFAFKLTGGTLDQPDDSFLLLSDVREFSNFGLIIDSSDEIVNSEDVIRLDKILKLGFKLLDLPVADQAKNRLGTTIDYTVRVEDFSIQQLVLKRPFFKSFTDPELTISRQQIVKVTNKLIVVKSETEPSKKIKAKNPAEIPFINPFNAPKAQEERA